MVYPNLIIPGGQKCGSSTLAYYLSLHPQCLMSTPKEPSFFSRQGNLSYIKKYQDHFHGFNDEKVVFDASTGYLFEEYVPERLKKTSELHDTPLKCLIILRKPVDRVISSYLHLKKRVHDRRGIEVVLDQLPDEVNSLLNEEEKRLVIAQEKELLDIHRYTSRYDDALWQFRYLRNSWYVPHVKRYVDLVGRQNLHVITLEDLKNNPHETMDEIYKFLDIDSFESNEIGRHINPTKLPPRMNYFKTTPNTVLNAVAEKISKTFMAKLLNTSPDISVEQQDKMTEICQNLDRVLKMQYKELSDLLDIDFNKKWNNESINERGRKL